MSFVGLVFFSAAGYSQVNLLASFPSSAVPETITAITPSFGPSGDYLITANGIEQTYLYDPKTNAISVFSSGTGGFNGLFIPQGYGALAGGYLVTGTQSAGFNAAVINSAGSATTLAISGTSGAAVAPSTFGPTAGKILIGAANSDGQGTILTLNFDGSTSPFANLGPETNAQATRLTPGGMVFAPSNFGSVGGLLLAADSFSGVIYSVTSSGVSSIFATVPVEAGIGVTGLRQMAFAPAGFGPFGGDLFVSVSGSQAGGGTTGSVDVLDSSGNVVAVLLQGAAGTPLDPRGLTFTQGGTLLISNADPELIAATASAFAPVSSVPEAGTNALLVAGLGAVVWVTKKLKSQPG